MTDNENIRRAALDLVQDLCNCESFEVEFGASGEGSLVRLIQALGIEIPPSLATWLEEDSHDEEP